MIGVDWGTSSFRAFRLSSGGVVLDRLEAASGITAVPDGDFAGVLHRAIDPWLAAGETRVLMAGMIGSRQGWREAPYLPCPADVAAVAGSLTEVPFEGAEARIVCGLSDQDAAGVPEVMRGEETQLLGVLAGMDGAGWACLPGSHSKWAYLSAGRIERFTTYLSGEAFAAIRGGTILGRMMTGTGGHSDEGAFADGVARSGQPGHLLHHLFGIRTLGLFGRLPDAAAASYLSGLLIGTEIRAALPGGDETVHLIGSNMLCRLYAAAIGMLGGRARIEDEDAAARGLALIGESAGWL